MFKLSIRTWVCNAAAVFSGQHGAVARQAEQAGCSRETVYEHAQKLERRLAGPPAEDAVLVESRAEIQRLRQEIAALRRQAGERIRLDKPAQRRLATTAFAMGLSLRQIEDVLTLLLAESGAKPPDHSTLGRWIDEQAGRAGSVLKALDGRCAAMVQTLALDEIFFGGDRPSSGSSRRA
jgi:transposase-like protein